MRRFWRFYFIRIILVLVVLELLYFAWLQHRNHKPVAEKDSASVFEHKSVKVNLLSNDMDKDITDTLKIAGIDSSLHGKTSIVDENNISYTPNSGFTGVDSFQYTISDGKNKSKKAWVIIQVNKNNRPVSNKDVAESFTEGTIFIDVLGNDYDSEGDSIYITGYSQPKHGRLDKVDIKFIYSSTAKSACTDSFRYILSDGLNNSDSVSVVINIKSKSDPCFPWLSRDMGDAAIPGSFSCSNNNYVITASGSDIWNNADGFRYAYQFVSGDCEMFTKVVSLEGSNEWAKAGIMVRESLSGDSKTAFVLVSTQNGATYQQRLKTNERMEGAEKKPEIKAPYWVKLVRKGNTFNYYISANGNTWENLGSADVPMEKNVYIGFAVTSHNNNETTKAKFSNYRLIGTVVRFQKGIK
jgi:regulation of enolase protein 1 (concanavalin A-like superfamily)